MHKLISSIFATVTVATISLNNFEFVPMLIDAKAASIRTSYTIYGDLNNDKIIDSFDVTLMRSKVAEGKYNKLYDFNYDNIVDSADLLLLSDYVLGKNCIFDAYLCEDADEDYVCDMLEVAYLKTNPDSKDTDGDTLTDFEEVVYTNTSPTDKYTRKLSVTDAADDVDEDKLTNKEEINQKTSPLLADSDEDGLSDYDELKKYGTDPNDDDSDDDNITDGDEVTLGLKPNSDKSNGVTYDHERTFDNKIDASNGILSYINGEDSPYEVSIDIQSAGNVEKALSVSIGDYSNTSEDNRIIGKSVSFSYDKKLSVDFAKIYFKPNKLNGKIENYMLFQFFPEKNYLLPVETKYTKDSAYVETSELGTFCLVDTKDLIDSKSPTPNAAPGSDVKVSQNDIVWDYSLGETEVLFYIDISNCATNSIEATKKSIHDFSEALFEHSENAVVGIIGYMYKDDVSKGNIIRYSNLNGSEILTNLSSVDEALENINTYTQYNTNSLDTAMYILYNNVIKKDIFSSSCENKYIFVTSDSSLSLTQNYTGYWYNDVPKETKAILKEMNTERIHVNTLFSDNLLNNSRAVKGIKYYKDACDEYDFGVYTKSSTGYFGNTGYARVYSDAITDIQSMSVMYTCSISPNAIPSIVERNAFMHSLPTSYDTSKVPEADANGNISFKDAAVKVGAATLDKNDNLVFKNLYSVCDESDLTRNGYDQLTQNMEISRKLVWDSFQITPFSDKILYNDDDGDEIPNKDDPFPDEKFDQRFIIVNGLDFKPTCDFQDEHYKKSKESYNSISSKIFYDTGDKEGIIALLSIIASKTDLPSDLFSALYHSDDVSFGDCTGHMEHASEALNHFLDKSGTPINYSASEMYELISSSPYNTTHLQDNLDRAMRCSEQMLKDKSSISFSTKSDAGFKVCCFDNKISDEYPDGTCDLNRGLKKIIEKPHTYGKYYNNEQLDWQNTVGEALGSLVCNVSRNGDKYTMNYNYYLLDIYEWAAKDGTLLSISIHRLHEEGKAKEFLMNGCIEGTYSWKKGEQAFTIGSSTSEDEKATAVLKGLKH